MLIFFTSRAPDISVAILLEMCRKINNDTFIVLYYQEQPRITIQVKNINIYIYLFF